MASAVPFCYVIEKSVYKNTLSVSAIEGLMPGHCVIVSSTTGVADYIKSYENGFVYEAGDAAGLAAVIRWTQFVSPFVG